jgi:hypothetical protein
MADYKNKLKGLNKKVKIKKSAPVQEVRPVDPKDITRATIELPTHLHEALKIHLARPRRSFKDYAIEALIEKMQNEGVEV